MIPLKLLIILMPFFSTIGSHIANSVAHPPGFDRYLTGDFPNSFFFPPISLDEVYQYVRSMKNKKCSVEDLPTAILKSIIHVIGPIIRFLINLSISKSIFPDCLKMARVVPLFKGGDSANISNYRPISVLNIFSKILEKHAFKYIYSYVEFCDVLKSNQSGFRSNRGTTQAIVNNCNFISIGVVELGPFKLLLLYSVKRTIFFNGEKENPKSPLSRSTFGSTW